MVNLRASVADIRLASVLETAVDGVVVVDHRGRLLVINRACEALFGLVGREWLGRDVSLLLPGVRLPQQPAPRQRAEGEEGEPAYEAAQEVEARRTDGTPLPLSVTFGAAATPAGRQYVVVLRDLRPRRDSERRLQELQASLMHMAKVTGMDAMGGAMAHELNQPLTALTLYLQGLARQQQLSGITPPTDHLERALKEASRMAEILKRMRSFIERREPERQPSDLNNLVDEAVELTVLGHRRAATVKKIYGENLPPVPVDGVQIQQVVVNLLRNALEAASTTAEPMVQISTAVTKAGIAIAVEDNGPGIAAEDEPDLFKAFRTRKRNGLGLGLAISRTIAQNHGGDLIYDRAYHGRGARFMLHIPVRPEDAGEHGEDAADHRHGQSP